MRSKFAHNFLVSYKNSISKQMQNAFIKYYKKNQLIEGYCTTQGSQAFSKRQPNVHSQNWRSPKYIKQKLSLSSLGIGTQGGEPTSQADLKMFSVLFQSIKSGKINVIDTDINFRYGKSQKTINATVNYLQNQHGISRNQLFIATKCGYIPNDIDSNLDQQKFVKILEDQGYITKADIVNQVHCISPSFIQFCTQKCLLSLGLQTIDLMYLNNPIEMQQTVIGKAEYFNKLAKAFECLEQLRSKNKIRYYGITSFVSFRSPPNEEGTHGELRQIVQIAQKVGGNSHGMRFVLVPFNLGMPQVLMKWQVSKNKTEEHIFTIAQQSKININFCCPLYQGRVAKLPFKSQILNNIKSNASKHLQLVRSVPKQTVLSTIFSTLDVNHLKQDVQTVNYPYLTPQQWRKVLPI